VEVQEWLALEVEDAWPHLDELRQPTEALEDVGQLIETGATHVSEDRAKPTAW
jgi:hypothetical protein